MAADSAVDAGAESLRNTLRFAAVETEMAENEGENLIWNFEKQAARGLAWIHDKCNEYVQLRTRKIKYTCSGWEQPRHICCVSCNIPFGSLPELPTP